MCPTIRIIVELPQMQKLVDRADVRHDSVGPNS